ncbi:MAG: hypothetical protein D6785_12155, partial [Planctomycetota bacterium]
MSNLSKWEPFRFHQERELMHRLEELLHMDLLEPVLKQATVQEERDYWYSLHEGQSFRLTPELAPHHYHLCQEVLDILEFESPIEFYIASNPTFNAASYLSTKENTPHLVVFHSGLVENFNDMEFRFVVGHEVGHIPFKASKFRKFLSQLFPEEQDLPLSINNLLRLWDKFAEISADRIGFLASPDLKSCVTAFFKLSSGLSMERIKVDFSQYLNEVREMIENYSPHKGLFYSSHPANPIRIKAVESFQNSKLYQNYSQKGIFIEDQEFEKEMEKLAQLMELHPDNQRDYFRLLLIASGGLVIADLDGEIAIEEEDRIIYFLSQFTVYPRKFLEEIKETAKTPKERENLFLDSVDKLLQMDPGERYAIFTFLTQMALSEKKKKKEE